MNIRDLRRLLPRHWNKQVFGWPDFYLFCRLEGIKVIEEEMDLPGLYAELGGQKTIYLHHKLRGMEKLRVAFHELAHAWVHAPGAHFFLALDKKAHEEAEMIAACLMIPKWMLKKKTPAEIIDEYGYPEDLVNFRLKVFRHRKV